MANHVDGDLDVLHRAAHVFGELLVLTGFEQFQTFLYDFPGDSVAPAPLLELQQQAFVQLAAPTPVGSSDCTAVSPARISADVSPSGIGDFFQGCREIAALFQVADDGVRRFASSVGKDQY